MIVAPSQARAFPTLQVPAPPARLLLATCLATCSRTC